MPLALYVVDAFSARPFGGNPAAVCILDKPHGYLWMQRFAEEMNLSETAFLLKQESGWGLRWFTPSVEVELCGHATLASAHVLWEQGFLGKDEESQFSTLSGVLTARQDNRWIELDFPAEFPLESEAPAELVQAINIPIIFAAKNKFDYFIEVENETSLRALEPDFALLKQLPVRGISVSARSAMAEFDFVSRFFAPGVGINEDPVTGSAHCSLAPYWSGKLGKLELIGYQASRRGGIVKVRLNGERVGIAGQAVTVLTSKVSDATMQEDDQRVFSG